MAKSVKKTMALIVACALTSAGTFTSCSDTPDPAELYKSALTLLDTKNPDHNFKDGCIKMHEAARLGHKTAKEFLQQSESGHLFFLSTPMTGEFDQYAWTLKNYYKAKPMEGFRQDSTFCKFAGTFQKNDIVIDVNSGELTHQPLTTTLFITKAKQEEILEVGQKVEEYISKKLGKDYANFSGEGLSRTGKVLAPFGEVEFAYENPSDTVFVVTATFTDYYNNYSEEEAAKKAAE